MKHSLLPSLQMADYAYELPDDRIARYPLPDRDASKLLVYRQGIIEDRKFSELPEILPPQTRLLFNDSRVIPARLLFHKGEGTIELFLLKPLTHDWAEWEVMVGNRRKFKEGDELTETIPSGDSTTIFSVRWLNRENNQVRFTANGVKNVVECIEAIGEVPLPPYLHRKPEELDKQRYQTVFAKNPGAVAAPTASLHFSDRLIGQLRANGVKSDFVTLHVGAGTFKPVTATTSDGHDMHSERFEISASLVQMLLQSGEKSITPVGTTAMRLLESVFYLGARLLLSEPDFADVPPEVGYDPRYKEISAEEALTALARYFDSGVKVLQGSTAIYIMPGFPFRFSKSLITNFHQPSSTLLLLIAAFIGDAWKEIYAHALRSEYRFLSYGDSMFLTP